MGYLAEKLAANGNRIGGKRFFNLCLRVIKVLNDVVIGSLGKQVSSSRAKI